MTDGPTPVLFVHGLWVHATSWQPWMERFEAAGFVPHAPGWPGDAPTIAEARSGAGSPEGKGINDVVASYVEFIKTLPAKPVAVGHSFGGLIVQKLLDQGDVAAAVAIDAAPIKGVLKLPISSLRVASVALRNPKNYKGTVSLTKAQFRYGFGNALGETESDALWENSIPSPGKPLFEASTAAFKPHSPAAVNVKNSTRGPLLLIAGGQDHTVPKAVVEAMYKLHGKSTAVTDYHEFPDRGHSLTLDSKWPEVADYAIGWLGGQGFGATP